jgi:predicted secreted protein
MPAVTGKSGNFKIGANIVANLDEFKLDVEVAMEDATNFSSNGWEESVPTIKKWSGNVKGKWDMADTTGQKALQDAILGGTSVAGVFNINGTNNYSGTGYVKKMSIGQPVKGVVDFSADIQGTAALTYA